MANMYANGGAGDAPNAPGPLPLGPQWPGLQVFAAGPVSGAAHDARLIVIRPAGTAKR